MAMARLFPETTGQITSQEAAASLLLNSSAASKTMPIAGQTNPCRFFAGIGFMTQSQFALAMRPDRFGGGYPLPNQGYC